MGYVKNIWATGDTITAEKLNKMEDGIEAANKRLIFSVIEDEENQNEETTYHAVDENGDPISFAELWEAYNNDIEVVCSIDGTLVAPTYFSEDEFYIAVPGEVGENGIHMVIIWGSTDDGTDQWDMRFQGFHLGLPDPDHEYGKFLSVNNQGEYVLVDEPGGEKEKYIVTFEQNEQDEWEATHDGTVVTPKSVYQQYVAGKEVQLVFQDTVIPLVFIDEWSMFAYQLFDIKESELSIFQIYGSYEKQEDEWTVEVIVYDMSGGGGGGAEPLNDDDLIDLLDGVSLFDAVYVTEDNVDKLLSDESGNILMW